MKAVQISKPGENFEVVERPIPQPARGQVRIKVEACGICHSDALAKEGLRPGIQYPRVSAVPGRFNDKLGIRTEKLKPRRARRFTKDINRRYLRDPSCPSWLWFLFRVRRKLPGL
jgi:hypothetical protein